MQQIPLTRGYYTLVDDEDYNWLNRESWCWDHGYAVRKQNGRKISMHRVILGAPDGIQVDHINLDKLDNRRCNLRLCTTSENMHNTTRQRSNRTGFKGIWWRRDRRRWMACISVRGKRVYLGSFLSRQAAAAAYDMAAVRYFGEFARTNF